MFKIGDVIITCDGQKVTTIDEINKIRDSHKVSETMSMEIDRNGKKMTVSVVLQEDKPSEEPAKEQQSQPEYYQEPYSQQIPFPFSWFGW